MRIYNIAITKVNNEPSNLSLNADLGPMGKGVWVVEAPGKAVKVMGTW